MLFTLEEAIAGAIGPFFGGVPNFWQIDLKKYPFLPFKYTDHDNLSNLVAKINENLDIEKKEVSTFKLITE